MNDVIWVKSSFCDSGNCVEVTRGSVWIHVRWSEDDETELKFTPKEWRLFVAGVKAGEFDL